MKTVVVPNTLRVVTSDGKDVTHLFDIDCKTGAVWLKGECSVEVPFAATFSVESARTALPKAGRGKAQWKRKLRGRK
jgi:hypothetical protein